MLANEGFSVPRCPRCEGENEPQNNFCWRCGLALHDASGLEAAGPIGQSSATAESETPAPRARWVTFTLATTALILLACVGFFVWALTPGGQEQMSEFATWAADEATRQSER